MPKAELAYVGIGSNLETPIDQVRSAIEELTRLPASELIVASSLYASPPMGPPDQPDYINAVVSLLTTLSSLELLDELQAVERSHGRVRNGVHWGPRTLDLDILLYGEERRLEGRLNIPHPGLKERDFVVLPLAEIAPRLVLPCGVKICELAEQLARSATAKRLADE